MEAKDTEKKNLFLTFMFIVYLYWRLPVELTGDHMEEVGMWEPELREPILVSQGVVEHVEAVKLPHTVASQELVV